jgi:hypothetical protein
MNLIFENTGRYTLEFEDLNDFEENCAAAVSQGEIPFSARGTPPPAGIIHLLLRIKAGPEFSLMAKVFQRADGIMAATFQKKPEEILATLCPQTDTKTGDAEDLLSNKSEWDRVRGLTRTEKLMLAPKGNRLERAILAQDNEPLLLYTLLKNPRITLEEVVRIARSSGLSPNSVDLILATTQWSMSNEIRIALVQNPRTPTPVALKLLPTLPEPVIRQIAKGTAVNQTLKQAAVRWVTGTGK